MKTRSRFIIGNALLALLLSLALQQPVRAQLPQYVAVDLNGSAVGSGATGINNRGDVVGNALLFSDPNYHGMIWSGGSALVLGDFGGASSYAQDINDFGQVTGYAYLSGPAHTYHGFLYSSGIMTDLGTVAGGNSTGLAINNPGQVTGWSGDATYGNTAFLYTGGSMQDIGNLGYSALGNSINNSGQIVGNGSTGSEGHGFLYSNGVMISITPKFSGASGINDAGTVVGSTYDFSTGEHAYVYSGGGTSYVVSPGEGLAINNAGQIVGYYFPNGGGGGPFLYSNGSFSLIRDLVSTPGITDIGIDTTGGKRINDWGQISAYGTVGGQGHALLLNPTTPFTTTTSHSRDAKIIAGMNYNLFTSVTNSTGFGTQLSLLDGTADANRDVLATFTGASTTGLASDVVSLSMLTPDLSNAPLTPFVLRLSYDEAAAIALFGDESLARLLWFDTGLDEWVNAVDGNTSGTPVFAGDGAYNPATDFHLGYFGVDTVNNEVWAVLDHNSEFAAGQAQNVPEPVCAAYLLSSVGLLALRRNRRSTPSARP